MRTITYNNHSTLDERPLSSDNTIIISTPTNFDHVPLGYDFTQIA